MLRKKLAESLTARIFLITALILLCAGTVTFGMIAWATPLTYTSVFNDDLARQVDDFAATLADTNLEDCGPLLDGFIRSSGADAALLDPDGRIVNVGSQLAIRPVYEDGSVMTGDSIASAAAQSVTWESGTEAGSAVTVTVSGETAIAADVQFADQDETYSLYVVPRVRAENLAVRALAQIAPWLLLALLIFSLLCDLPFGAVVPRRWD